jgi:hypothetical protein
VIGIDWGREASVTVKAIMHEGRLRVLEVVERSIDRSRAKPE